MSKGKGKTFTCPADHTHGGEGISTTCYRSHGCRCGGCRAACAKVARKYRRNLAYGRVKPIVLSPAGPVADHIRDLQAHGHGYEWIGSRAGVNGRTAWKVQVGRVETVTTAVAEAILAVRPDFDALKPGRMIPNTGTVRRLRALAVLGWTWRDLSRILGVSEDLVHAYAASPLCVQVRTYRAVARLYEDLWDRKPDEVTAAQKRAASLARNRAARNGWAPPLAWDDDTIDDPSAVPAHTATSRWSDRFDEVLVDDAVAGRHPKITPLERRAAVERLWQARWSDPRIAKHLDIDPKTVARIREELHLPAHEYNEMVMAA